MNRVLTTSLLAAGAAVLLGSFVAAEGRETMPVNIQPPTSVEIVLYSTVNAGKSLAFTGEDGKGSIDVASLSNLGKLVVIVEKCPDRTRVLIVATGAEPESANCSKKVVGALLLGADSILNVRLPGGGMSVMKKGLIGSAAGAGALIYLESRGGNDETTVALK